VKYLCCLALPSQYCFPLVFILSPKQTYGLVLLFVALFGYIFQTFVHYCLCFIFVFNFTLFSFSYTISFSFPVNSLAGRKFESHLTFRGTSRWRRHYYTIIAARFVSRLLTWMAKAAPGLVKSTQNLNVNFCRSSSDTNCDTEWNVWDFVFTEMWLVSFEKIHCAVPYLFCWCATCV